MFKNGRFGGGELKRKYRPAGKVNFHQSGTQISLPKKSESGVAQGFNPKFWKFKRCSFYGIEFCLFEVMYRVGFQGAKNFVQISLTLFYKVHMAVGAIEVMKSHIIKNMYGVEVKLHFRE